MHNSSAQTWDFSDVQIAVLSEISQTIATEECSKYFWLGVRNCYPASTSDMER